VQRDGGVDIRDVGDVTKSPPVTAESFYTINDERKVVSGVLLTPLTTNARFEAKIYSSLAYRWKFVNRQVDKQKANHPDRFYTLRYEDLVSQPAMKLKEICGFLGIDFSDEMMNYRSKLNEMLDMYPAALINLHHKSLLKPINTDNLYAWKKIMTPRQIRICDNVVGAFAENQAMKECTNPATFSLSHFVCRECYTVDCCSFL